MRFKNLLLPVILLLIAAFFRTWQIDRVPPGLHDDEVINTELVEQYVLAGHPQIFYTFGGREGLFHFTFGFGMRFIGYNVLGYRWAGLMWGMLGLAASYALTRRLLGQRVALIGLAFAAISFWSIYEGRAATRSVSLIGMSALAALAFVQAWTRAERGQSRLRDWLVAGALLGLTIYTYIASRVIPGIFVLLLLYFAITQRAVLRSARRSVLGYMVVAIIVATPLVVYLNTAPAIDMRFDMLTGNIDAARLGNFGPVLRTTLQTLGMFVWRGDAQWHYNVAGTPVFDPLASVLFIVGVLIALWRVRQWPYAFYLIWIVMSLVPGMLSEPAPHYMRTAAAQVAAYTFVGLGSSMLINWANQRSSVLRRATWIGLAGVWLVGAAVNYHNFFDVWPANDEVRLYHQANVSDMARYLDQSADTTPVVGCSPFLNEKEDWIRSSRQTMHFVLRRTDLPIRWHDCRDSLVFPNNGQWREFILYFTPLEQNIPPSIMSWLTDTQPIHLNEFADSTLYTLDARTKLTAALAGASQAEVTWESNDGQASLPIDFGHNLKLLGYHVEKPSLRAGKSLIVTTYWQAIDQAPPFLTVFIHVLSAPDQIAAQSDRQSVLADTLQPGDVLMQIHSIDLPNSLAPGLYRLSIGLYSSETNQRLPVYAGEPLHGDRVLLQSITIKP